MKLMNFMKYEIPFKTIQSYFSSMNIYFAIPPPPPPPFFF